MYLAVTVYRLIEVDQEKARLSELDPASYLSYYFFFFFH